MVVVKAVMEIVVVVMGWGSWYCGAGFVVFVGGGGGEVGSICQNAGHHLRL